MGDHPSFAAPPEALDSFRDLVVSFPVLSALARLYRVRFVVDANVVLSDLRWLARRRNPEARTILQEVLAAGTVIAFAPPQLEAEVLRHLPRIAKKANVPLEALQAEWSVYRSNLRFRAPSEGEKPPHVQDPDDLPYLFLHAEIGADAIYTNDSDVAAMGGYVIGTEVVIALRDYTRATSIDVTLKIGGTLVAAAGGVAILQIWEGTQAFFAALGKLPVWAKWLFAGVVVTAVLHPRGRTFLRQALRGIPEHVGTALNALAPLVLQAFAMADQQRKASLAALERVQGTLPLPSDTPAWARAIRVCREEGRPLSTASIAERILRDGYVTRSRDFNGYVQRVLRERAEFVEVAPEMWYLAREPVDHC